MKKYDIQVVTNEHWIIQLDLLQEKLNEGWKLERADSTNTMIVYLFYKEEE